MNFKEIIEKIDKNKLPKHIGIIMDGNGRWARIRGLPRVEGHKEGLKALENLLEFNRYLRVEYITVYAFSKENWHRDKDEVDFLMSMALKVLRDKIDEFKSKGIRFIHIGDTEGISPELVEMIKILEDATKDGDLYTLCVAFNYSGRYEILNAFRRMITDFRDGKIDENSINESIISNYIYHPEIPDIDLVIRTSGEQRISNFMLWRVAYSELYFTDVLWPDFTPDHFVKAIIDYQSRERRFGRV